MLRTTRVRPWICAKRVSNIVRPPARFRHSDAAPILSHKSRQPDSIFDNSAPGALHDDRTLRQIFDSRDVWREFSSSSKVGLKGKNIGLFQNRYLVNAEGFERFARSEERRVGKECPV